MFCHVVVLADNFDILDGKVSFEVPLVITGDKYSITREYPFFFPYSELTKFLVMGDSGNWSSNFTIKGHDI
jgi:hypothetical protein